KSEEKAAMMSSMRSLNQRIKFTFPKYNKKSPDRIRAFFIKMAKTMGHPGYCSTGNDDIPTK
ncbi:MAG: hypothetical protein ACYTCN_05295, partial [Planctomycetota bacterium]